jgi:hypothetical protein
MQPPFTVEQFLDAFRDYNDAVGPAPVLLMGLAIALIYLAFSRSSWRHRGITTGLAVLWVWSGAVYHWEFFSRINPAARLFGALFLLQAAVLLTCAARDRLRFAPRGSGTSLLGWAVMAYALVLYPLLGMAAGHGYPEGPFFGAPCPITIFSLGMLLWASETLPVAAITIPVIWALLATSAAVQLGIPEDFGLAVAALLVVGSLLRRRLARAAPSPTILAR